MNKSENQSKKGSASQNPRETDAEWMHKLNQIKTARRSRLTKSAKLNMERFEARKEAQAVSDLAAKNHSPFSALSQDAYGKYVSEIVQHETGNPMSFDDWSKKESAPSEAVLPCYKGEFGQLKQGTKVRCHGYDGAIVRHYDGSMYEVRLPGGVVCTEDFMLTAEEIREHEITKAPAPAAPQPASPVYDKAAQIDDTPSSPSGILRSHNEAEDRRNDAKELKDQLEQVRHEADHHREQRDKELSELDRVKQQRDELLAALKRAEPALWLLAASGNKDAVSRHAEAQAAIAAAEGRAS